MTTLPNHYQHAAVPSESRVLRYVTTFVGCCVGLPLLGGIFVTCVLAGIGLVVLSPLVALLGKDGPIKPEGH